VLAFLFDVLGLILAIEPRHEHRGATLYQNIARLLGDWASDLRA
jgi:hypothetical protein